MKNTKKTILTSALLLTLFGCSSFNEPNTGSLPITPTSSFSALSDSSCCESLQSLPLEQIQMNDQLYATLEASKPKISIDGNESFAVAYALSDSIKDRYLDVSALVIENTVLSPAVSLYDANWNRISKIDAGSFTYAPAKFGDNDRLEVSIDLTSARHYQARYIVVHADHDSLNETFTLIHPEELYAEGRGIIPMPREKQHATLVPTGLVRLKLNRRNIISKLFSGTGSQSTITDSTALHSRATGIVTHKEDIASGERHEAIKQAIADKDFATALSLVEESERNGDVEARRLFLNALENQ
ncbi:MalM family protein [Photobacterium sagamiensis]|uniref:MalM family protein n=1 Tax=Photobacterium sagamiensis TaxID=2910241 RepID=UPI003D0B8D28